MAQGSGGGAGSSGTASSLGLVAKAAAEKEQLELREYEKIIRFADDVFKERGLQTDHGQEFASSKRLAETTSHSVNPLPNFSNSLSTNQSRTDFGANPRFLKKSEELVRDEFQIERERLEQEIQQDWDQRHEVKGSQRDQEENLDISDILARALVLVQPATESGSEPDVTADNRNASDSNDDDSYYSSRHDTPESRLTSRIPNQSANTSPNTRIPGPSTAQDEYNPREAERSASKAPSDSYEPPPAVAVLSPVLQGSRVPGLNNYHNPSSVALPSHGTGNYFSVGQQGQTTGGVTGQMLGASAAGAALPSSSSYHHDDIPSPLIRAHNLTPAAPQPTQVPPLAVNMQLAELQRGHSPMQPAPATAQAVARRRLSRTGAATSPETSSHSGRPVESKKRKPRHKKEKKKRRSDQHVSLGDNAFIKPEPRSQSPLTAPAQIRPHKRARHENQPQTHEPTDGLRRAEPAPDVGYRAYSSTVRDGGPQVVYERPAGYTMRSASTALVGDPRYAREVIGGQEAHVGHGGSPSYYVRRAAPIIINDPHPESQRYYREPHEVPRLSVRPEGEYVLQAAPAQPTRIIVDADGREYIEPPPAPIRYSVAPSRPGQPEIIYERPARALSRHPGTYEQPGSSNYANPASPHTITRRVVTQPEYAPSGYGDVRYQDPPNRPIIPQGEPMHAMAPPPERRPIDENHGGYVVRSATARPPESGRYEPHHEYVRVQSVRPQDPGVQDFRRGYMPQYQTQVSQGYVREPQQPMEQPPVPQPQYVRREYSARPAERYYEPSVRGGPEEVAFIERPHGQNQEIVYANDVRREVYR